MEAKGVDAATQFTALRLNLSLTTRLPQQAFGAKPMIPSMALRAAFVFPKAICGERDVVVGQLAIRAIGYSFGRRAAFGFCFHVVVPLIYDSSKDVYRSVMHAPIDCDTPSAIAQ